MMVQKLDQNWEPRLLTLVPGQTTSMHQDCIKVIDMHVKHACSSKIVWHRYGANGAGAVLLERVKTL